MTIFEAYNSTKKRLAQAGIEDNVFEAKQIIKHITGLNATQILSDYSRKLTLFQENNLTAILRQREIRYPLQYIFGEWDFYGFPFLVGPGVLVPRADTEILIDECLEYLKENEAPQILDLCAGSGCIGISLGLKKLQGNVLMVEKFSEALRYAKLNIEKNNAKNVAVLQGDIFESVGADKEYDLIVSNPPYIPKEEMSIISPETTFEPETALLAKKGGMEFYEAIVNNYTASIKSGGMLAFEVGINEAERVKRLLDAAGYKEIKVKKDLNGIERVVSGIKFK